MGLVQAKVLLANPRRPDQAPMSVEALADTGSMHLCIPLTVQQELGLAEFDQRTVTLADGSSRQVPYVGPVEIRFKDRVCLTGAIVFGDQVLFGAIPMEDMDLIIIPSSRTFDVNPLKTPLRI